MAAGYGKRGHLSSSKIATEMHPRLMISVLLSWGPTDAAIDAVVFFALGDLIHDFVEIFIDVFIAKVA